MEAKKLAKTDTLQQKQPEAVAVSAQQREITELGQGRLKRYREYVVGCQGWGYFAGFEFYSLFATGIPGVLGLAIRSKLLPCFMGSVGRGFSVGRGVTIRGAKSIQAGTGVFVDDYAVLDVRGQDSEIVLGDKVLLGRASIVAAKGAKITLGDGCNIGTNCRIASQSKVEFGNSVLVAAYAYIGPGNHRIDDLEKPIIEQEMDLRSGVSVGDNVWIGARATVLDGVSIGRDAVIGAHSLVREDVPERAIVAGSPAKIIRYRDGGSFNR